MKPFLSLVTRPLALLSSVAFPSSYKVRQQSWAFGLTFATTCLVAKSSSQHRGEFAQNSDLFCASSPTMETGYLDAQSAAALDVELMSQPGFTLDQLMELAGLAVAQAVFSVVVEKETEKPPRILIICGPGNNGGDGLVAARHLVHFGCDCTVVYPKRSSREPHYANLVKQCEDMKIPVLDSMPEEFVASQLDDDSSDEKRFTAVVDAMFGFSFRGSPRAPFDSILKDLVEVQDRTMIVAVDVPSGWHVDEGDVNKTGFNPAVLVSLTAPKNCARQFPGRHFCGGRFVPHALAEKYSIRMPPYPGSDQVMELKKVSEPTQSGIYEGWEEDYYAYLKEKEAVEAENARDEEPEEESWESQYAAYLAEKESKEFAEYAQRTDDSER